MSVLLYLLEILRIVIDLLTQHESLVLLFILLSWTFLSFIFYLGKNCQKHHYQQQNRSDEQVTCEWVSGGVNTQYVHSWGRHISWWPMAGTALDWRFCFIFKPFLPLTASASKPTRFTMLFIRERERERDNQIYSIMNEKGIRKKHNKMLTNVLRLLV